jgi:hypothetical protein
VYVAAYFEHVPGTPGWATSYLVQSDGKGNPGLTYPFLSSGENLIHGIAVDDAGNLLVSGSTGGFVLGMPSNAWVIKLHPVGAAGAPASPTSYLATSIWPLPLGVDPHQLWGTNPTTALSPGQRPPSTPSVARVATAQTAITDEVFAGWASQPRGAQPPQQGRPPSGNPQRQRPPSPADPFVWPAWGPLLQAGRPGG